MIRAINTTTGELFDFQVENDVNSWLVGSEIWNYTSFEDEGVFILDIGGWYLVLFCVLTNGGHWKSLFEFTTTKVLKKPICSENWTLLEECETNKKHLFRYYNEPIGWKRVEDILD
jgi:hypothetical protein